MVLNSAFNKRHEKLSVQINKFIFKLMMKLFALQQHQIRLIFQYNVVFLRLLIIYNLIRSFEYLKHWVAKLYGLENQSVCQRLNFILFLIKIHIFQVQSSSTYCE